MSERCVFVRRIAATVLAVGILCGLADRAAAYEVGDQVEVYEVGQVVDVLRLGFRHWAPGGGV